MLANPVSDRTKHYALLGSSAHVPGGRVWGCAALRRSWLGDAAAKQLGGVGSWLHK
jgi:hypothetical protein